MRKCSVTNISNHKPCKRTDVTLYTLPITGMKAYLCTKHIEQVRMGKDLSFHTPPLPAMPTMAITESSTEKVYHNIRTGTETTQEKLPMPEITLFVRRVVRIEGRTFHCLPGKRANVPSLDAFKSMAFGVLSNPRNRAIVGILGRIGNDSYLVTRTKSVRITSSHTIRSVRTTR